MAGQEGQIPDNRKQRSWTRLQNGRVLQEIIGRGLLSRRELQIASLYWRETWGFSRDHTGPGHPITTAMIREWTGMDDGHIRRIRSKMRSENIILSHPGGTESFNEKHENWAKRAKSAPPGTNGARQKCPGTNGAESAPKEHEKRAKRACYIITKESIESKESSLRAEPAKSAGSQADKDRSEFLGFWRREYHRLRNEPYRIRRGEGNAAARIVKDAGGLEIAIGAATRMLGSGDAWVRANTSIRMLESHLNRFLGGDDDESPADRMLREANEQLKRARS